MDSNGGAWLRVEETFKENPKRFKYQGSYLKSNEFYSVTMPEYKNFFFLPEQYMNAGVIDIFNEEFIVD